MTAFLLNVLTAAGLWAVARKARDQLRAVEGGDVLANTGSD